MSAFSAWPWALDLSGVRRPCDLSTAPLATPDLDRDAGRPVGKELANAAAVQDFDKLEVRPLGGVVGH
jgi:hypothetical protein